MLELLVIVAAVAVFYRQLFLLSGAPVQSTAAATRAATQLARMQALADRLYAERKWLAAEKAYLNVLKRDHKNVGAYSHLGIIYSLQKSFDDAIECFKIAANFNPNATTWQNLGLAYYENGDYEKSVASFEKAVIAEPSAHRYLALGKSYRKLGDLPHMITAFEQAVELDASPKNMQMLFEAYRVAGERDKAMGVYNRIKHPDDE